MNYLKRSITTKRLITTIIFSLLFSIASANPLNVEFRVLDNEAGLVSDNISAIVRDKDGYMWISTDEGLCRYDGYKIKYYTPFINEGYEKMIRSLAVDQDNLIWIGTRYGLYTFDPRNERFEKVSTTSKNTLRVKITPDNTVIASLNGAIQHYIKRPDGTIDVETYNDLKLGVNPAIFFDKENHLWINSNLGHIVRYRFYDKAIKERVASIDLRGKHIDSANIFFEDNNGALFVGTWQSGIYEIVETNGDYSLRKIKFDGCQTKIPNSAIIRFITQDDNSKRYLIGTDMGLYIVNNLASPESVQHISSGDGTTLLSNKDAVCCYYNPKMQQLLIGTMGGGVNILDLSPQFIESSRYKTKQTRSRNGIIQSIYDDGRRLWLGVKGEGLVLIDKATQEESHYLDTPYLKDIPKWANSFYSIIGLKHHNQVWLGSRFAAISIVELDENRDPIGVKHIPSGVKYTSSELNDPLASRTINSICEDSSGNVWIGNFRDLFVATMREGQWLFQNINSLKHLEFKFPFELILNITTDSKGQVWVATLEGGVYRISGIDGGDLSGIEIKHYTITDNLQNITQSIYCDSQDQIWVGASGVGLFQYDSSKDSFEMVNLLNPNETLSIMSIVEYSPNNLFWGSNGGLYHYTTEDNVSQMRRFTIDDGLSSNICQIRAICAGSEGEIYVGTNKGYSIIRPDLIAKEELSSNIKITDIKVSNTSILYPSTTEFLSRGESGEMECLTVPHSESTISLDFSCLLAKSPQQSHYKYRLRGVNSDWVKTSQHQRTATFCNLSSGRYTFEVKLDTPEATITSLPIWVRPAPYASWWAWTIYILALLTIVIVIARSVVERIKLNSTLRDERYRQIHAEKLHNSKLQFFTNISHELLTPLMIIGYSADELERGNTHAGKIHTIIKNNISRLSRLLEQILEFRKAESGNLKLRVSRGDLAQYIDKLTRSSFTPYLDKKSITLTFRATPEVVDGYFDPDKIDKIVYNLVTNAIKYNVDGGFIEITITTEQQGDTSTMAIISVRNGGAVIAQEQQSQLFKRFYDGEFREYNAKGWGIGLSLVQDLVTLHKGEISVTSDEERGTCFTFNIPLLESVYDVEQLSPSYPELMDGSEESLGGGDSVNGVTILLVEDNEDLSLVMQNSLERHYRVLHAADGQRGIEMAREHNPDIIVSDVIMPCASGYTLCSRLKSDLETSHIPIILLTAKSTREDRLQGLTVGAEAYLQKPVDIEVLVAQINSTVSARRKMAKSYSAVDNTTDNTIDNSVAKLGYTTLDNKLLQSAIEYIDEHLVDSKLEVSDLAQHLNISSTTLYRKIKSLTTLSPNDFIRDHKLSVAHKLISDTGKNISIAEVAFVTGFSSAKYFTACFSAKYGYPPSQLKKRQDK